MASTSTLSDLSKLTVPQLKALCKERRITGYSKLSKAVLLQKLAEAATPANTSTSRKLNDPDQGKQGATAGSSVAHGDEVENLPISKASSSTRREGNVAKATRQPAITVDTATRVSTKTSSAKAPLPPLPSKSSQNHTAPNTVCTQKTSGTKRLAHIDVSASPKRIRTSFELAATVGHEPPLPRTFTFQQKLPVGDATTFKVPDLPMRSGSNPTPAKQPSGAGKPPNPCQPADIPKRYKPLVVISRPKPAACNEANKEPPAVPTVPSIPTPVGSHSSFAPSFRGAPLPVLSHISFPPRASERKWVYRWAIILSAISPIDMRSCMLVSRMFRYAVYLSAAHILSRNYAGRRLDAILEQYPKNMTNFWPYLRLRMTEVSERRQAYKRSFLGRYAHSIGYDPLCEHLWTSPDDEKQVDVAIRFVLTRMWFAVSVGAYGHDASSWSRCVIQDVCEVARGEVWLVITEDGSTGQSCSFYVLEATCEVIGQPPSSQGKKTLGYSLRADWSAWISQRSRAPLSGPCSLLECVKWSNTEDYYQGISKAWLHRVQGEDADNIAKRNVAKRYILACVVANGISGKWMSTNAMAQEFAGLPVKADLDSRAAGRSVSTVNMYLPAHHHIESVHFTTSKGEALHEAVAVVQTPGREYYVLRDNGMQVGCEEEGIPGVWQQILGCDTLGRAH